MKTKRIHNLILKLKESGKIKHNRVESGYLCPADRAEFIRGECTCGAKEHNALVDFAAEKVMKELGRISND